MTDLPAPLPPQPEDLPADPRLATVRAALATVLDPEIGLDLVALGLVHAIALDQDGVRVELLVTSPACPMGELMEREAAHAVAAALPGLRRVEVELRRDVPWGPERMTAEARRSLGWPDAP